MSPKPYRDILDSVASDHMPDGVNLYPHLVAQIERKPLMQTLRASPILTLIIVILAMLMLTGVAYAVGNLLGYIPGMGLVERDSSIRVLAGPVSQTRNGITVTVKSAILGPDKTLLKYSIENGPPPVPESDMTGQYCPEFNAILRLPDGSSLAIMSGEGSPGETSSVYSPISVDLDQVSFVLPCIPGALQGTAPEGWEVPLRFVPAPSDMVLPVNELSTPTPEPAPVLQDSATPASQTVVIERALQIDDKLLFVGAFIPDVPTGARVQLDGDVKISDANGQEISYETPDETFERPAYTDPNTIPWSTRIAQDGLSYPLTFTFSGNIISEPEPQATAEFEFDADRDIKPGQAWQLSHDFVIAGYNVRLLTITTGSREQPGYTYNFEFECDPDVSYFNLEIAGHTPIGFGGGGGGDTGSFGISQSYAEPLTGKVKIILSHLAVVSGTGTWQAQWSPEK